MDRPALGFFKCLCPVQRPAGAVTAGAKTLFYCALWIDEASLLVPVKRIYIVEK